MREKRFPEPVKPETPARYYSMVYWHLDGAPWCSPFGPICGTKREAMEYALNYRIPPDLSPPDDPNVERVLYEHTGHGWHVYEGTEQGPFVPPPDDLRWLT